jgi:hypothetical protein
MEPTYMVRGVDGAEYGPATLEQLDGWIREGRVDQRTVLRRSDQDQWLAAGSYVELRFPTVAGAVPPLVPLAAATTVQAAPGLAAPAVDPALDKQMKAGASWFFWIAGLSLINSIATHTGSTFGFVLGLGVTQIIDTIGQNFAPVGQAVALVLDALAAGLFVLFGGFARRGHAWAFIVGMILYGLDALFFALAQDWLAIGFHGFALFCLFRGFKACRFLRAG